MKSPLFGVSLTPLQAETCELKDQVEKAQQQKDAVHLCLLGQQTGVDCAKPQKDAEMFL